MNLSQKQKAFLSFGAIFLFAVGWSILLYSVGAQTIVEKIGIKNGYLIAFGVAALGGISSVTATSFYATVITLAAGGLNPFILGAVAGFGVTIGDSFFYYLGTQGRRVISGIFLHYLEKFSHWLHTHPDWTVPLIVFLYTGFSPLPNDILTVSLGLSRYSYKKIILPLLIGNIILTIIIAYFASQGIKLF